MKSQECMSQLTTVSLTTISLTTISLTTISLITMTTMNYYYAKLNRSYDCEGEDRMWFDD